MPPRSSRPDPNDSQRDRVYTAERLAFGSVQPEFPFLRALRDEAERVIASPTWQLLARHTRQEHRTVVVKLGRGRRAFARVPVHGDPSIYVPRRSWTRWALFHELAHCARGRLTLTHGPHFTASYLRLVRECWDPAVADRIAAEFATHEVRVFNWAAAGAPIPVPDPATLDRRADPGLEEDRIIQERRARIANEKMQEAVATLQRLAAAARRTAELRTHRNATDGPPAVRPSADSVI